MTKDGLSAMIRTGEGAKVAFKRDDVRPEQPARGIVSSAMEDSRVFQELDQSRYGIQ